MKHLISNVVILYFLNTEMTKSLKPLRHRKSNVFALRRKALKENDSTIQNVSDFWRKSEEKENEAANQSVSLFSAKKGSFDVEFNKEIDNANVSGIAESVIDLKNESVVADKGMTNFVYRTGKIETKKEESDYDNTTINVIDDSLNVRNNNEDELVSEQSDISMVTDLSKQGGNENRLDNGNSDASLAAESNDKTSEDVSGDENSDILVSSGVSEEKTTVEEKSSKENSIEEKSQDAISNAYDNDFQEQSEPNSNTPKKDNASKSSQIDMSISTQNDELVRYKDHVYYVKDISILKQKNRVSFLINNNDLETGVMHLTNASYINTSKADRSFCIFMMKGRLDVVVNDVVITMKKNSMCVVNKGDMWSLKNDEHFISKLFLCYSLK